MSTRITPITPLTITIQDDGTSLPRQPKLNFIGAGVSVAEDAGNDRINVTIPGGGGGGGGHVIQEEGTPLAQRANLNFVGSGVVASDGGAGPDSSIITIGANDFIWEDVMGLSSNGDLPAYDNGGNPILIPIGTTDQVLTVVGGQPAWADSQPMDPFEELANPHDFWWWYDEFFYPTPQSHFPHWETFGSVSTEAINIGGVIQTNTTGVANNVTGFKVCAGGLTSIDFTKKVKLIWRVKPRQSQADSAVRIGFFNPNGANPSGTFPFGSEDSDSAQRPHIYFKFDGTGNWFTKTITSGGVSQSNDTSVAVSTSAFTTLQIELDPSGPEIRWTINNVLVHTQTTDLPSGDGALGVAMQTGVAAAKGLDVDSMFVVSAR